jgi:hypothetical protein
MRTRNTATARGIGWALVLALGLIMLTAASERPDGEARDSIPWGAMYTPNEHLTDGGMTGAIKHYRGPRAAAALLEDLAFAEDRGVRLILTLGSVAPVDYLDADGHLSVDAVRRELDPFLALASEIAPFIAGGTIWGIRFIDEPHDPAGYPPAFEIDPAELSEAFALIRSHLGDVRVGSTAPPAYMARVPGAGFSCGQVIHAKLPSAYTDPVTFHRDQSALAHEHDLAYVASLNANTNAIDNETFFRDYRRMCEIETVDFATAWQWPQGHHPMPSFGARFEDTDPPVRTEISRIPAACER